MSVEPPPSDNQGQGITEGDRTLKLGPVAISPADMSGALQEVKALIASGHPSFLCFCEANLFAHATQRQDVRDALKKAHAIYADGVVLLLLARLKGFRLPQRVTGPSFLLAACEYGLPLGWKHFFYGGAPGVAEQLVSVLRNKHPELIVGGTYSPPFRALTAAEDEEVIHRIESSSPDLVWVGLGGPKQEFWMAEHVGRLKVPVMLGVGAAFDFHSGARPWAPIWIRNLGFEWMFRMLTGGRSTLLRNVRCISIVSGYLLKTSLRRFW